MFDNNNQFSMNMMKTICGDLKEASEHMISISQKTVKERLAETLVYLEETFGKNEVVLYESNYRVKGNWLE